MAASLRFPPLPSIPDLLKLYRLQAKKQLAQNFLMDERLTNKIVKQLGNIKDGHVVEVGPGPGCLTRSIIKKFPEKLIVIEKDVRFKPTLEMLAETFQSINGKMDIIYNDVLRINFDSLFPEEHRRSWDDRCPKIYMIGNLPFNVATPLIIKWLYAISTRTGPWSMGRVPMCLTFQKEVAERLVANPLEAQRSRLSIMAQAWTNPRLRFIIPGRVFIPKPDVDVGVVTFEPLAQPRTDHEFHLFEKITRHVFTYRRRRSYRAIRTLFPPDYEEDLTAMMFKLSDLDPTSPSIQFSVEDVNRLCTAYKYLLTKHPEVGEYNYRASSKVISSRNTVRVKISEASEEQSEMII